MDVDTTYGLDSYDFNSYIRKLNKELLEKEAEIKKAKDRIAKLLAAKIYTRAELKLVNEEQIRREKEKEEYEKENIDLITKRSLNIAKSMRKNSKGLDSKSRKEVEISAINIEKKAFEKEIKVKKSIIKEKKAEMNRLLADKVFYESKIKNLKKDKDKEKINTLKNYSKDSSGKYFEFLKQSETLKDSIIKAQNQIMFLKEKLNINA